MKPRTSVAHSLIAKVTLTAVMTALVTVATRIVIIPNPMGGYFNFGDVMIFATALTFGYSIGGFAGGVGSAIADIAAGYPIFVIPTLIVKGLEGFLAGLITDRKSISRDVLAVALGGTVMIVGYFLVELYVLQWGLGGAAAEIPINIGQIIVGGFGVPIAYLIRRRMPEVLK